MELMETSLESLLLRNRRAPLPLPKVLHIAVQICRGLEYLHPHIVHRCATTLAYGLWIARAVDRLARDT